MGFASCGELCDMIGGGRCAGRHHPEAFGSTSKSLDAV